jgi:ceramide glucosyltransferase
MPSFSLLMTFVGFACLGLAAAYTMLTLVAGLAWNMRRRSGESRVLPPISILKPLCGAEPGLYEHLRSFCLQNCAEFQIVYGVRDSGDPACAVVRRLMAEFPHIPMELVINPELHGSNCKISNVMNMLPHARHAMLVIADSDAFVGSDYLTAVASPLLDERNGLVTCIYRGTPTPSIWSRLGAMYINEWYVPSVLLAWLFGHDRYVSGQTLCLRRETLAAIGGLAVLANHLADDYRLGELVRGLGLKIVLSSYVVKGQHHETDLHSLVRHELRWMSTIRVLRPNSFRFIFLGFSLPLALAGIAAAALFPAPLAPMPVAWALFAATLIGRLMLHFLNRPDDRNTWADLWLLPVRDVLILWVWCRTFFTSQVTWRGYEFDVDSDGVMHPLS